MKVIRTVDTYFWHCKKYYGIDMAAADEPRKSLPSRKARRFDPNNWKNNDLYALLGLQNERHTASFDDIRTAYRAAVLSAHPDKQAQRLADNAADDSLFKVLQKAFQVLSDPERRQQYDSIDFDEAIPRPREYTEQEFWDTFPDVFAANARFSVRQPVPELSRSATDRVQIESFYNFWFNFESWRRFEFLDEEEVEGGASERAEKRYIEKKNKAARQKRKTEDNARISRLVDLAYKSDPRVRQWKEEERKAKEAKRTSKVAGKTPAKLPLPSSADNATACTSHTAASNSNGSNKKKEEQVRQAMAAANEAKLQKRAFRSLFKDNNFFAAEGDVKEMERVSLLVEQAVLKLSALELRDMMSRADRSIVGALEESLTRDTACSKDSPSGVAADNAGEDAAHPWTIDQIDLLIRAVKSFPPGVPDRWHRITDHLSKFFSVSYASVLRKAEDVKSGRALGDVEDAAVPVPRKRDPRVDQAEPTILVREDAPNAAIDQPWSSDEQQKLEAAMKSIGPDQEDRWAKIAEMLPGRSKADIVRRVKEIAAMLKNKKLQHH